MSSSMNQMSTDKKNHTVEFRKIEVLNKTSFSLLGPLDLSFLFTAVIFPLRIRWN